MVRPGSELTSKRLTSDVCVIGAGPVGIAIARRVSAAGATVTLIESGGVDYPKSLRQPLRLVANHVVGAQALNRGANDGRRYTPLRFARARAVGGSTRVLLGHGLMARPLDPIDFVARKEVVNSGWPFGSGELDRYHAEAQRFARLGPYAYGPQGFPGELGDLLVFDGEIETTLFQFARGETFAEYREELQATARILLITGATVVDVEPDADGRSIRSVEAAAGSGGTFSVAADTFVLAAGGIENARFLLHCSSRHGGRSFGNEHDVVGRYFMEHPQVLSALWRPPSEVLRSMPAYGLTPRDGFQTMAQLRLTDETLYERGLLNSSIYLLPTSASGLGTAVIAARHVRMSLNQKFPLPGFIRHVSRTVAGLPSVLRYVRDRKAHRAPDAITIALMAEQEPNPTSRVTLGRGRDRFGIPRPVLRWQLTEFDTASMRETVRVFAAASLRNGFGSLESLLEVDDRRLPIYGNWHHIGTTRMHEDPQQGVVDPDSRVHGSENLYVAGSSVFPTSGCSNPTLSAVALALRLADHLAPSGP